jgi:hypothetical protein
MALSECVAEHQEWTFGLVWAIAWTFDGELLRLGHIGQIAPVLTTLGRDPAPSCHA